MNPEFDRRKDKNVPEVRMEPIAPGSNYLQADYSGLPGDLSDKKLHLPEELFQRINSLLRAPTFGTAMELHAEINKHLQDCGINPRNYTGIHRDQITFLDQPPHSPFPILYQVTVDRPPRDLRIVAWFGFSAVATMVPNDRPLELSDITQLTGHNLPGSRDSSSFDSHHGLLSLAQCRIKREVFEQFNLDFGNGIRSTEGPGYLLSSASTASIAKRNNLPENPYKKRREGSWLRGNPVVFLDRNHQHWQVPGLSLLSIFQNPKTTAYNQTVVLRGNAGVAVEIAATSRENGAPYNLRIESSKDGSEIVLNNSGPGLAPLIFRRVK